ncbi:selenoprotein H [Spatholobus suberectus]|nr:selenoprotein H [Spatholobus suberectus]
MPPAKRKAEQAEEATAAPARVTRAAAKRSAAASSDPPPAAELPEERKAKKAKGAKEKKVKKESDGGAVQSENRAEEGDASGNVLDSSIKTVVVEHCKQCNSFKTRAHLVKEGLEKAGCGIRVILNPEKPRRGCFEIRQEGGKKFITLLDMKRPFKPMKDLDMDNVISDIIDEISKAG